MLRDLPLVQLPCLVLDLETTGLDPKRDEIIEIGAVLVRPGEKPKLLIDTLVKPRRVAGTQIHGITEQDVEGAPALRDVIPMLRKALANRVLVAHNAPLELRFLEDHHVANAVPHICTLGLSRALLGRHCSLDAACYEFGVEKRDRHGAADDALMTADLYRQLARKARAKGLVGSDDLKARGVTSCNLEAEPISTALSLSSPAQASDLFLPRGKSRKNRRSVPERDYLELVLSVIEDLEVSAEEASRVRDLQKHLPWPVVRVIHAKIFQMILARYSEDRFLDDLETANLSRLSHCLDQLGWSPGALPSRVS